MIFLMEGYHGQADINRFLKKGTIGPPASAIWLPIDTISHEIHVEVHDFVLIPHFILIEASNSAS